MELVAHGVTGLLATPGDIEAFAEALQLLVDDALLRTRLAQQALAQARRRTWPEAHAQLLDAYASALNGPAVRRPARMAA